MMLSRRQLPSLNALRAFEVSGRCLNFRAAAQELGVTQGAVAQQVRSLEKHLGVLLFTRLPKGLALTSHGAAYLSEITRAFDVIGDATRRLVNQPDSVTISVTPSFASKLLIPRLSGFRMQLPGIGLKTIATEVLSDFDRDQVDIAVRQARPPFAPDLEARLLFHQELVAVANPLLVAGCALPLTLEQLKTLPLLHDAYDYWPLFLQSSHPVRGPAFNQTTLALDAALAGQGVALACRAFVSEDMSAGRLVQVVAQSLTIEPHYFLVKKRSVSGRDTVNLVWNWCLSAFSVP